MIKLKSLLNENYEDWVGNWIHYSTSPYLKLNYKQRHMDILGIYLFPEEFSPKSYWQKMPYKFTVKVPNNLKVLDLAKTKRREFISILDRLELQNERGYKEFVDGIIKSNRRPADYFWEFLSSVYLGKYAKWNSDFRKIGYDAIFDDTRSIHSEEHQLIILDPTKITIVDVIKQKSLAFYGVKLVMNRILNMLKKYNGYIKITEPTKKTKYGRSSLDGNIFFSNLPEEKWKDDEYRSIHFKIYPSGHNTNDFLENEIFVGVSSTPSKSYGIGANYDVYEKDWSDVDKLDKEIDWIVNNPQKYINHES